MNALILLVILIWFVVPIFIANDLWTKKGGSPAMGLALGFFLGWIGVLIAALGTPPQATVQRVPPARQTGPIATRECPSCKEQMRRDASVCPHCRRESKAWTFYDGFWWAKRADGSLVYLDERRNAWRQFESDAEAPLAPRN